jgi:hypothetical protein
MSREQCQRQTCIQERESSAARKRELDKAIADNQRLITENQMLIESVEICKKANSDGTNVLFEEWLSQLTPDQFNEVMQKAKPLLPPLNQDSEISAENPQPPERVISNAITNEDC